MKVLFDQGTPVPLRRELPGHDVHTAAELGWSRLSNGDLLREAESAGLRAMVTTDQNLRYQQNLSERSIGIVVLKSASWPRIRSVTDNVAAALESVLGGGYTEVDA